MKTDEVLISWELGFLLERLGLGLSGSFFDFLPFSSRFLAVSIRLSLLSPFVFLRVVCLFADSLFTAVLTFVVVFFCYLSCSFSAVSY